MKRMRPFLKLLFSATVLLCLVGAGILALLESHWITQHLQQAIIDGVKDAIGARAEIPSFEWNWRTLTIEMRGFTIHGSEPLAGPPLFTAPVIRLRLRILSFLEQNVELSSLVVNRPRFYLEVGANGATNVPGPKHPLTPSEIFQNLLNLKLPYVKATEGLAQINNRLFPVDLVGDHVAVLIQYRRATHRYQLRVQSPSLRLGGSKAPYFDGSVEANGELWHEHFSLLGSRFHSRSTDVRINGTVEQFDQPVADWHLASTFATTEALRRFGITWMGGAATGSAIVITGIGHHDPQTPLFFDGNVSANNLSAQLPGLSLHEGAVRSQFLADHGSLQFSNLVVSSREGQFAGRLSLAGYRDLQLSGTLSRIEFQSAGSALLHRNLPWSGTISGPLELSATFQPAMTNLVVHSALQIAPNSNGIPVSGDVRFLYRQRDAVLAFENSAIRLPNTQITFNSQPNADLAFAVDSTNLSDFNAGLVLFGSGFPLSDLPALTTGGNAHLQGTAHIAAGNDAHVEAALAVTRLQWKGVSVDRLLSTFSVSPSQLRLSSLAVDSSLVHASVRAQAELSGWQLRQSSPLQASGSFSNAKVQSLLGFLHAPTDYQLSGGLAGGTFTVGGTLATPGGDAQVTVADFSLQGQHLESAGASFTLSGNRVAATHGQIQSGNTSLTFSGSYDHANDHWDRGTLQVALDSNRFPLSRLQTFAPALQSLDGQAELHARTAWAVNTNHVAPLNLQGDASLRHILWKGVSAGDLEASAATEGQSVTATLSGNLRGSRIAGSANLQIATGTPAKGSITFDSITLNSLMGLLQPSPVTPSLLSGSARGDLAFDGPLENPAKLHALLQLRDLQVKGPPLRSLGEELAGTTAPSKAAQEVILQTSAPVTIELKDGIASVRSAQLTGRDTEFSITGTVPLIGNEGVHLLLNGGVDLRLLQLLYPEIEFGGQSKIAATVTGALGDPQLSGTVQLASVSVFSPVLPNGLSDLAGTIQFDQRRATLQKMTAHTGGGLVTFGGFITYSANHPLLYRLESSGQNVRVRYANGISVTGNSQFSLTGTSDQSLLSGNISVARVVLNPNADVGNILALAGAPSVAADHGKDFLSQMQLDIHVDSAPNLQLDTELSSGVQAEIDLQLRGTPKQPIFLGSIEANEGDIKIFGSRYSINRGQVSFTNPARLEPVLDLDLQTQARGITVDITVSGTLNKLNINYRSDPPLQPREIIALLTVGRTPQTTASGNNVQSTNDADSLQSGANSILGQAIAPVSNRLSKLFGITNIKIDPLVQGVTNTPQARLTLEQQVSRQITVTYITNLSQTSEQIFRLEYSLNPQFSLVALRDDNGEFGIDILYKKRFK